MAKSTPPRLRLRDTHHPVLYEINTGILLRKVLEPIAQAGIQTELVQVGGTNIHGCRACGACAKTQGISDGGGIARTLAPAPGLPPIRHARVPAPSGNQRLRLRPKLVR